MRYWTHIETIERNGIEFVIDYTPEDMPLEGSFDDSIDPDTGKPYWDLKELYRKIEYGDLEWFVLRVRAMVDGHEFGTGYCGGMLYDTDKIRDVLTDGIAEDLIYEANKEAREAIVSLKSKLEALVD